MLFTLVLAAFTNSNFVAAAEIDLGHGFKFDPDKDPITGRKSTEVPPKKYKLNLEEKNLLHPNQDHVCRVCLREKLSPDSTLEIKRRGISLTIVF
jgi:hypothetical protein